MITRKILALPNVVRQAAPGNVSTREIPERCFVGRSDQTKSLQVVAASLDVRGSRLLNYTAAIRRLFARTCQVTSNIQKRLPSRAPPQRRLDDDEHEHDCVPSIAQTFHFLTRLNRLISLQKSDGQVSEFARLL